MPQLQVGKHTCVHAHGSGCRPYDSNDLYCYIQILDENGRTEYGHIVQITQLYIVVEIEGEKFTVFPKCIMEPLILLNN
jgi:hypothetical protein